MGLIKLPPLANFVEEALGAVAAICMSSDGRLIT